MADARHERDPESHGSHATPSSTDDLLVMQVKAFLEAAECEDVDIDVETVEDLMQAIPSDFGRADNEEPVNGTPPPADKDSDTDEDIGVDGSALYNIEDDGEHLFRNPNDVLKYYVASQAQETWTPQEVKDMIHHLKERGEQAYWSIPPILPKMLRIIGMSAWIKEYVLTRSIPIPKLLRAFGISLVSSASFSNGSPSLTKSRSV